jgi:hypothetical protein
MRTAIDKYPAVLFSVSAEYPYPNAPVEAVLTEICSHMRAYGFQEVNASVELLANEVAVKEVE